MDPSEFRRHGYALVDWIAEYLAGSDKYPVLPRVAPGDLQRALPARAPEQGEPFESIFADFERVIVPALTLAVGLAMPEAIATSLVVIAANTVIALAVRGVDAVDWPVAAALTAPMLAGGFVGAGLGRRIDGDIARVTFAVLLLVVAVLNAIVVVT